MTEFLRYADRLLGWDAHGEEIKARLVEHRRNKIRIPVILANALVSGVVAVGLWNTQPHNLLLGWLAAITCISILNVWGVKIYDRKKSEYSSQHWGFLFTLGTLASGIAWGLGALVLYQPASPTGNMLMVAVICGMTAGNVLISFAIPATAYAYFVPAILLSMFMPMAEGGAPERTLAVLWGMYLVVMVVLTRSTHNGLAESYKLSYENAQLAKDLAKECQVSRADAVEAK